VSTTLVTEERRERFIGCNFWGRAETEVAARWPAQVGESESAPGEAKWWG